MKLRFECAVEIALKLYVNSILLRSLLACVLELMFSVCIYSQLYWVGQKRKLYRFPTLCKKLFFLLNS